MPEEGSIAMSRQICGAAAPPAPQAEALEPARRVRDLAEELLSGQLLGVYLYGSATLSRLRPESDVDVLILMRGELPAGAAEALTQRLLALSGPVGCAARRPLEVTVVNRDALIPWRFPPRCEYMYGEWLRKALEAGECPLPRRDPDIALLLWQARACSFPLLGREAPELLPVVSMEEVRRAMACALPNLLAWLRGDERNVLLTLARMWVTAETGALLPKDEAAAWAISRLPEELAAPLETARRAYLGQARDCWEGQEAQVAALAAYMQARLTPEGDVAKA